MTDLIIALDYSSLYAAMRMVSLPGATLISAPVEGLVVAFWCWPRGVRE